MSEADERQWVESNQQLEYELESICRDYLTRGGKVDDVQFLASQLGISYAAVVGEVKQKFDPDGIIPSSVK